MAFKVTSEVIATLLAAAARSAPNECCGLLLGEGSHATEALEAVNVAADPRRRFEIDPAVLLTAHRAARDGGKQVVGYYHSHPGGDPGPSIIDRESASGDGRVWAIVAHGEVAFWRDGENGFEALSYEVPVG